MTRIPIIPTALVVVAAAIMVALGFWQIGRAEYKDQRIETLKQRIALPGTEYPYTAQANEDFLYRELTAQCSEVLSWKALGGQDINNRNGWRQIATCREAVTGVEFKADMGIGGTPDFETAWTGGAVTGRAIFEPDTRNLAQLIMREPRNTRLMIVARDPVDGLLPSRQPQPSEEENSSWAYAGQWFFFALTALVIYFFAVRSRVRRRN